MVDGVTPSSAETWGSTPTMPISVVMIPNTPRASTRMVREVFLIGAIDTFHQI